MIAKSFDAIGALQFRLLGNEERDASFFQAGDIPFQKVITYQIEIFLSAILQVFANDIGFRVECDSVLHCRVGFHFLVFIALVNTVISLYYYLLIVKAMYITPSDNPIPTFRSDRCTKWGLALCTLGIIGLGIASIVYQSIDKLSFGI